MSEERLLTRRRFMALAAAFTGPLLPGAVSGVAALVDPPRTAGAQLTAWIRHRDSAAQIGRAYLRTAPGDADVDRLVDALVATIAFESDGRDPLGVDDATLAELVARRIVTDFTSRDVAVVDGWVLSRTEARLCALVALA